MKTHIKKLSKILLFGLAILFIFLIFISIINQNKELPDGTLISKNRLTGQIGVKRPNNEFTFFQKNSPFYKEILDVFNNY